ncbi:hypothetical protein KQ304_06965 [Synechococcus sp. CS-1329]|uniref:hypothetical protein n=1 Tax=Synechococcus sp. CS-1329 TaxID=2847975 RepID=UPI00223BF8DF|nr:hypothetical protein [Synechococcus sp. CS-1329]MCT0218738.1 hypothetical protein [Synechococcus sp. CS-1329]
MTQGNNSSNILQFPWLPKTDPPQAGGAQAGTWLGKDQQKLGEIANTLVYEVTNSRVNALPSPWSRALQFEQAVRNPRYPTRAALLEELFGCFATVGLWEMFGLKLEAEKVALTDLITSQDEAVGPFARSLFGSRPNGDQTLYSLADGSNPWSTVHVLKVEGVVIGFTSPATVLCPAVHLPTTIPGMNWTAKGRFGGPTSFLGAQQRQALADWLAHVNEGLLNAPDHLSDALAGQMDQVFTGFIETLNGGHASNVILSDNSVISLRNRPTAVSLLARAAKGGESPSLATVELGDRRERPLKGTPVRPVILLDAEMPNRLGLTANDIVLYKAATLEAIGGDKTKLERQYGHEIDVITPDDIFLPELYLLPGESALANSWLGSRLEGKPMVNGIPVTPLLPLNERIRELFSSAELARSCSLRLVQTGSGMGIEMTLMLPLQGSRTAYPITKHFPIKEQNLIDQDLPVITLWPNIADLNWKHFFIFCDDSSSGLTVDGFEDYDLHKGREGQESVKYFTSKSFPDLIKLIERGQNCGLIPVNPPPPASNTAATWRVGIDFGTSFTNFFIDDGSGPKRKPLDTRVISLAKAQEETKLNQLYKYFIPETLLPIGSNPPTSTALNTFGWQEVKGTVPKLYHESRIQWPSENANALRGLNIRTNFKWRQLQYQKPFLKELALLISCNAAAAGATELAWSVSYPSAFSKNEAQSYRRLWSDLCNDLAPLTGLKQIFVEDSHEGGLQTEAVAFASYFGNHQGKPMVHTACLDVGGGTTDISLWQENRLLHQVSIPFAGRNICTSVLQNKPAFMHFLFPPSLTGEVSGNKAQLRQDPNFNSWFDNCLRYQSDQLLSDRMPIHRADQERQLIEFVSLMAVSFGGLYHYLGLILKSLNREGLLRKQATMPIYMGGNGARFLNWLDESGSFSRNCDADQLMGILQSKSSAFESGQNGTAETTLSDAFKDEAACGLISSGVNLQGIFDPKDEFMVAGEGLMINDRTFNSLDRVRTDGLETISSYEIASLTELRQFASNYDEALNSARISSLLPIRSLTCMDSLWGEVETQVRALCLERISKRVNDLEPEPAFITGLKALNHVLSQQWAERF